MKKGLIAFTTLTLATVAFASCGEQKDFNSLTISNKSAIQASWRANDGVTRQLELAIDPVGAINVNEKLQSGDLTIESSHPDVVKAQGLNLTALKEGQSTVSVKYKNTLCDSVDLNILSEETCKELYQTTHTGKADDPLDAADAVKVAKAVGKDGTPKDWFVKDVVYAIKDQYSEEYKNISVYIGNKSAADSSFLAYRLPVTSATQVEMTDTITINSKIYNYNNDTPETFGSVTLVKVDKGPGAQDPDPKGEVGTEHAGTLEDPFTPADAVKFAKFIGEGVSLKKYYVEGEVTNVNIDLKYGNCGADMIVDDANKFLVYRLFDVNGEKFTVDNKFDNGDVIKLLAQIKAYVHTDKTVDYETAEGGELVTVTPATKVNPTAVEFVDGASIEMNKGITKKLSLSWTPDIKVNKEATWSSDNEEVATVVDGTVTANGVGTANITVTSVPAPSVNATIQVVVVDPDPQATLVASPIAGAEYVGSGYSLGLGRHLFAVAEKSSNYGKTCEVLASAPTMKLEDAQGGFNIKLGTKYVNGVVSGTYFNLAFDDTAKTVWAWNPELKAFTTENGGKTYFFGGNGTYDTFSLYTTDKLTAEGSTYYGVACYEKSAFSTEVKGVELNGSKTCVKGFTITLTANMRPHTLAVPQDAVWESLNPEIATVNAGVVTGVSAGKATIKITAAEKTATFEINVLEAALVLDFVTNDYGMSETAGNQTFTSGNYTFGGVNSKILYKGQANQTAMVNKTGCLYNKTAFTAPIKGVVICTSDSASASAKYFVTFGSSEIPAVTTAKTSESCVIGKSGNHMYACSADDATYFNVSVDSTANGQIVKIAFIL